MSAYPCNECRNPLVDCDGSCTNPVELLNPAGETIPSAQGNAREPEPMTGQPPVGSAPAPIACGLANPSYHDCPNMKEAGGGFEGERYRCDICGKSYFLDYEDMK